MSFVLDDIIDKFWKDGRVKELEEFADHHDFEFIGRARLELQTYQIKDFHLFRGKNAKRLKGILMKQIEGLEVRIYDYIYYGEGDKRKTTVFELCDPRLNLPRFLIRPKRSIKWVAEVFQKRHWFYPEASGFHAYYEIEGPYPDEVADCLSEEFVDLVSSATRLRVEGDGPYLMIYHRGKQTPVHHIEAELDFAFDVRDSLIEVISEEDLV